METYVSLRGYKHGEVGRNHFQTCQNGISEKFTLDEIAKELNCSAQHVYDQKYQALKKLRIELAKEGDGR